MAAAAARSRQYSKAERVAVQRETIAFLERAPKRKFKSTHTKYGNDEPTFTPMDAHLRVAMRVSVSPADTLDAVAALADECARAGTGKVGFLVMANDRNPGGGYARGTNGQEESVCRRTALATHLAELDYPLAEYGSTVVHALAIVRESEARGYAFLTKPMRAECVLAAAYHDPPTDARGLLCDGYRERTRRKIDALLAAFHASGCTHIVLGAFGCGAFGNPPGDVASLFAQALKKRFAGAFTHVVFAVLLEASGRNYRAFADALGHDRESAVADSEPVVAHSDARGAAGAAATVVSDEGDESRRAEIAELAWA